MKTLFAFAVLVSIIAGFCDGIPSTGQEAMPPIKPKYSADSENWHNLDGDQHFYSRWRQFTAEGKRYLLVVTYKGDSVVQTVVPVDQ